mmetsp:Transcript_69751/g.166992  ORF Transcript_69751/g.166992 Transcript_69751/m.166992 type:complete len:188 (-) Transcript_69751:193-756(-)
MYMLPGVTQIVARGSPPGAGRTMDFDGRSAPSLISPGQGRMNSAAAPQLLRASPAQRSGVSPQRSAPRESVEYPRDYGGAAVVGMVIQRDDGSSPGYPREVTRDQEYGVRGAAPHGSENQYRQENQKAVDELHEYEEDICARIARTLAEANRTLEWSNLPRPDTSNLTASGPASAQYPQEYTEVTEM